MANFNYPINPSTSGPVQYIKDGNVETVNQDTTTPSNSNALPVIALDNTGNEIDFATEAKQDTQILELQDIEADLESIDSNITTSNNTLSSIDTSLNNIEAVNFATEATLGAVDIKLGAIETDVDSIATNTTSIDAEIQALNLRVAGSLVPEAFDYQQLQYVTVGNGLGEVESITYKTGGASGTTVAVVTLAYDSQNRVISVTRT